MNPSFIPLPGYREYPPEEMLDRARGFAEEMHRRRTVRDFSDRPAPRALIKDCLRAAGSAPSGANQQPWYFVAVADPDVKKRIREAAELEEREFYALSYSLLRFIRLRGGPHALSELIARYRTNPTPRVQALEGLPNLPASAGAFERAWHEFLKAPPAEDQ